MISILFLTLISTTEVEKSPSTAGSTSVTVNQRFFSDRKLGNVNGFSSWGALSFDAQFGLYEFPFRVEPYVGVGYMQNSSILCGLDATDACARTASGEIEASEDHLKYKLFTLSLGVRQRAWDPSFFVVVPYAQVGLTYRYGRVTKITQAEGQQKVNLGGDLGGEFGGGLIFSFFYDREIRAEMETNWGLRDFALMTSVRYLPAGWFRHGLGLLKNTGGWDFGMGLILDW